MPAIEYLMDDFDRLRLDWFTVFSSLSEEDKKAWLIDCQMDFDQLPFVTMEDRKTIVIRHARKLIANHPEIRLAT